MEDIRELGFSCIEHILRVCGQMHVMPACMNFLYRIADQQRFVMVRSVDCDRLLFSSKTVGKNEKQPNVRASLYVMMTCKGEASRPRASKPSSDARATSGSYRGIVARTSRSQSRVMLSRLRFLCSSSRERLLAA